LKPTEKSADRIPDEVVQLLGDSKIGYLSVSSKKGGLYSYPVAFHYSNSKIYMMTPNGSAKMKLMRENPEVSFIVDNRKLALEACGTMIQGKAKVFSIASLAASIVSLGPKMASFAKKYPGMFTFYARGKELPPDRKLYKYRVIRIDPSKFVFWTGYKFGRFLPGKAGKGSEAALELKDERSAGAVVGLIDSADEELEMDELPQDSDWLGGLRSATEAGEISEEEGALMGSLRIGSGDLGSAPSSGHVSTGEKKLLKRWKTQT
jgi:pyridoxamine 5'-phosphate oxidase-like protein